jgi:protease-4
MSGDSFSPKYLGGFMNSGSFALGLLYSSPGGDRDQFDMSLGLGFGNRAFSLGFANRSVYSFYEGGRDRFFSGYETGFIIRPGRFFSLGASAGGTYDGTRFDAGGELGIRPLGTPLVTLSGAYSRTFFRDEFWNAWSLGITLRPVPGLILYGAYHDTKTFSLSLSLIINGTGISGGILTPEDSSSSNTIVTGISSGTQISGRGFLSDVHDRAYVEISLYGPLNEGPSYFKEQPSLLDLLAIISKAAGDSEVGGLVIQFDQFSAGREALWELRSALSAFRAKGKRVIAITDNAGFDLYYLLSAADRIVLDPQGSIMIPGYAIGRSYFRNTLDKLGIGVRELRYLDYKTSAETFTRSSLSDADREQYGAYLDSVYAIARTAIMQGRRWTSGEFEDRVDEFLYSARRARARGLIDNIGRYEDAGAIIRELEGRNVMRMRFDYGGDMPVFGRRYLAHDDPDTLWGEPPHVAVIYASGQTDMDQGMRARAIAALIEGLSENSNVKAIVLRVNSPGGSALAADHVAEAVKKAKERVPVVVSMGEVAGSGGYWVSMYGSSIFASPYTLTGSIGVIGTWFYDNGLGELLGFNVDAVQQGAHADLLSGFILPRRDLTEEEESRYRAYILDLYDSFVEKAAEGRGLTKADIERVAQGRLYGGSDALRAGLVDGIGGLWDAVQKARELAGIERRELILDEYPRSRFVESVGERLLSGLLPHLETPTEPLGAALEELRFRLSRNGEVMPLMPLDIVGAHE